MIRRNLHIQTLPTVPQILRNKHSSLLPDQKRSAIRIAPYIIRADTQIRNLQSLDTVNVQPLIENTMFNDRIPFSGSHGTRTERVPSSFDVTLDPLLDMLDVLT